jgi:hypothetical protein
MPLNNLFIVRFFNNYTIDAVFLPFTMEIFIIISKG